MKQILLVVVITLVAISIMSCSSVTVNSDYDQDYNFSKLKTFGFLEIPADAGIDQLDAKRLSDAVKRVMGEKGYMVSEEPDFGVAMHFGAQTKTQIDSYGYGYGYAYGYGLGGPGAGAQVWQYDEGTLLIDFIDMEKNELIWRGSGTKILAGHPSVDDKVKNINDAVAEILSQFPPNMK
jgi:Domain of unknown function (DUF4136)